MFLFQSRTCEDKVSGRTRAKRRAGYRKLDNSTTNYQSYVEFRVKLPEEDNKTYNATEGEMDDYEDIQIKTNPFIVLAFLPGVASLLMLIGILLYKSVSLSCFFRS